MAVQDWDALREAAGQGYADGIMCLATIETVERSNNEELIERLHDADAARAARILIDGALVRLHIFVCRGFSPARHADDLHLRTAIDFLKEPGRLDEEPLLWRRTDLAEAIRLFELAAADPRLVRLKHMRDKLIAHMARYDETIIAKPTYNDLFDFTRLTAQIWERLSYGAGTAMVKLRHQVKAYSESADAFWSRWEETSE
ncbi:hypothetical protein [Mesorhizobium sp. M0494]|uniref:AbiU2 domain-containing protein n=1 Tax=unclassified Mesorhizobium TaxID=325217 RepID=UPI0033391ABB